MREQALGFPASLAPRSVSDATIAQLRAWILDGTLEAGARLNQDDLACTLGVSRMPVRAAIRQLASEGLLDLRGHRGAVVASLDPKVIREVYLVRAALEGLAAGLATDRVEAGEIARMEDLLARMRASVAVRDDEPSIQLDRRFHACVYAAADAPFLAGLIEQVRARSDAFRRAHAHIPGRARVSVEEHAARLRALTARDRVAVERLTREHLAKAADHLIAYVSR